MARGAKGVADAWRTSIVTALEDKASKRARWNTSSSSS
jgi:type I restriction enzyme M protein